MPTHKTTKTNYYAKIMKLGFVLCPNKNLSCFLNHFLN